MLETALQLASSKEGKVAADEISIELGLKTRQEHKKLTCTLRDLQSAGRLQKIATGMADAPAKEVAEQAGNHVAALADAPPGLPRISWRWPGSRRTMPSSGLRVLVQREVVRKDQKPGLPGTWHLINDQADMPEDEEKAARLRNLRLQHKQAVNLIDTTIGSR